MAGRRRMGMVTSIASDNLLAPISGTKIGRNSLEVLQTEG